MSKNESRKTSNFNIFNENPLFTQNVVSQIIKFSHRYRQTYIAVINSVFGKHPRHRIRKKNDYSPVLSSVPIYSIVKLATLETYKTNIPYLKPQIF